MKNGAEILCVLVSCVWSVNAIVSSEKYNGISQYRHDCGNSVYHYEFCDRRKSGFYSHKDPSCYVKCSSYGNHAVRACPRGQKWAGRYHKRYQYNRCEKVKSYRGRTQNETSRIQQQKYSRKYQNKWRPIQDPAGPPRQLHLRGERKRNRDNGYRRKLERYLQKQDPTRNQYKDPNKPKNKDVYYEPVGSVSGRLAPIKKKEINKDVYEPIGPNIEGHLQVKPGAKEIERVIESFYYNNLVLGRTIKDPLLLYGIDSVLPSPSRPLSYSSPALGAREYAPKASHPPPDQPRRLLPVGPGRALPPSPSGINRRRELPAVPDNIRFPFVPVLPPPLPRPTDDSLYFPPSPGLAPAPRYQDRLPPPPPVSNYNIAPPPAGFYREVIQNPDYSDYDYHENRILQFPSRVVEERRRGEFYDNTVDLGYVH